MNFSQRCCYLDTLIQYPFLLIATHYLFVPSSSTTAPRDSGKAPAVEARVLGGVSSTRILRSRHGTPIVGGSSSQSNPPETEFETPSDMGNDALPPFDATTYVPQVYMIGHGGSLQYRPPLSDTLPEANEKLRMWEAVPRVGIDHGVGGAVVGYQVREMTVTPGYFVLLIRLIVGGDPLPLDPRIHEREGAFDYLLGKTPDVSKSGHVTYPWLRA
ncbi:hypothetical protein RHSIM_Rhsim11G0000700 [Rhododendron simsii]|uniref:Uncharacterized protein n=1 Tax=Rhododendron simsii TaxID=118357 RepID=A0A834G876_RHOSS|nr:hypothetical protein RHSIM_Rhsim11G0000700 [Rhododendron simsii]